MGRTETYMLHVFQSKMVCPTEYLVNTVRTLADTRMGVQLANDARAVHLFDCSFTSQIPLSMRQKEVYLSGERERQREWVCN